MLDLVESNKKMATQDRSPSSFAGQSWTSWADSLAVTDKYDDDEDVQSNAEDESDSMKLNKKDMDLFGRRPFSEELTLAKCELCGTWVKPQALKMHIEVRHGSSEAVIEQLKTLTTTSKSSSLDSELARTLSSPVTSLSKAGSKPPTKASLKQVPKCVRVSGSAAGSSSGTKGSGRAESSSQLLQKAMANPVVWMERIPKEVVKRVTTAVVATTSGSSLKDVMSSSSSASVTYTLARTNAAVGVAAKGKSVVVNGAVLMKKGVGASHPSSSTSIITTSTVTTLASQPPSLSTVTTTVTTTRPTPVTTPTPSLTDSSKSAFYTKFSSPTREIFSSALAATLTASTNPLRTSTHTITSSNSSSHGSSSSKSKKLPKERKLLPCKDREFDADKHCGVLVDDGGKPCTRSLTCKTHALGLRRKVAGRTKSFDQLLREHKAAKDAQLKARMEEQSTASSATHTASSAPSLLSAGSSSAVRLGQLEQGDRKMAALSYVSKSALHRSQRPLRPHANTVFQKVAPGGSTPSFIIKEEPSPILDAARRLSQSSEPRLSQSGEHRLSQSSEHRLSQSTGEHSLSQSSEHRLSQSAGERRLSQSSEHRLSQSGEHRLSQSGEHRLSQSSGEHRLSQSSERQSSQSSERRSSHSHERHSSSSSERRSSQSSEHRSLLSSESRSSSWSERERESTQEKQRLPCLSHHPQPAAVCTFGARRISLGCPVFSRRTDRIRAAFQSALDTQLNPPPHKKLCTESSLPRETQAPSSSKDPYDFPTADTGLAPQRQTVSFTIGGPANASAGLLGKPLLRHKAKSLSVSTLAVSSGASGVPTTTIAIPSLAAALLKPTRVPDAGVKRAALSLASSLTSPSLKRKRSGSSQGSGAVSGTVEVPGGGAGLAVASGAVTAGLVAADGSRPSQPSTTLLVSSSAVNSQSATAPLTAITIPSVNLANMTGLTFSAASSTTTTPNHHHPYPLTATSKPQKASLLKDGVNVLLTGINPSQVNGHLFNITGTQLAQLAAAQAVNATAEDKNIKRSRLASAKHSTAQKVSGTLETLRAFQGGNLLTAVPPNAVLLERGSQGAGTTAAAPSQNTGLQGVVSQNAVLLSSLNGGRGGGGSTLVALTSAGVTATPSAASITVAPNTIFRTVSDTRTAQQVALTTATFTNGILPSSGNKVLTTTGSSQNYRHHHNHHHHPQQQQRSSGSSSSTNSVQGRGAGSVLAAKTLHNPSLLQASGSSPNLAQLAHFKPGTFSISKTGKITMQPAMSLTIPIVTSMGLGTLATAPSLSSHQQQQQQQNPHPTLLVTAATGDDRRGSGAKTELHFQPQMSSASSSVIS